MKLSSAELKSLFGCYEEAESNRIDLEERLEEAKKREADLCIRLIGQVREHHNGRVILDNAGLKRLVTIVGGTSYGVDGCLRVDDVELL